MKIFKSFLPLVAGTLLAAAAHAQYNPQICSNQTIYGTYVVACSGFVTPPGSPTAVPMTVLGTVATDDNGVFSGTVTNSIAGTVFPQNVSGPANTKSDCTGTITYNKGQADAISITYVVAKSGDEIKGMSIDKGANLSCTLTRIRR